MPDPINADACPVPLPSMSSAQGIVDGIPGALPKALAHTAGRAALIASGLYVAGFRGKDLIKGGLAGAVAIETFVLIFLKWETMKRGAK